MTVSRVGQANCWYDWPTENSTDEDEKLEMVSKSVPIRFTLVVVTRILILKKAFEVSPLLSSDLSTIVRALERERTHSISQIT